MNTTKTTIVWFRRELRLDDNPAFIHALKRGPVIPVFIFPYHNDNDMPSSTPSRWNLSGEPKASLSSEVKLAVPTQPTAHDVVTLTPPRHQQQHSTSQQQALTTTTTPAAPTSVAAAVPASSLSASTATTSTTPTAPPTANAVDALPPWDGTEWSPGTPSRWWLHKSLLVLSQQLSAYGLNLIIRKGLPLTVLLELTAETRCHTVFWNRHLHSNTLHHRLDTPDDDRLAMDLSQFDITVELFSSDLLFDHMDMLRRRSRRPFRSFDSFFRVCSTLASPPAPIPAPPPSHSAQADKQEELNPNQSAGGSLPPNLLGRGLKSVAVEDLGLLSTGQQQPQQQQQGTIESNTTMLSRLEAMWSPGCGQAHETLIFVLAHGMDKIASSDTLPTPTSPPQAPDNNTTNSSAQSGSASQNSHSIEIGGGPLVSGAGEDASVGAQDKERIIQALLAAREQITHSAWHHPAMEAVGTEDPLDQILSLLSPHLAFGELSVRRILHTVQLAAKTWPSAPIHTLAQSLTRRLLRREHAFHLLNKFPDMVGVSLNCKFNAYPWSTSALHLLAWQRGSTGFPIVDACMRCIAACGFLGSTMCSIIFEFLVKCLSIPWQAGFRFLWPRLCTSELAVMSYFWQHAAGSLPGDSIANAPFHAVEAGKQADPLGNFIRRWVPELQGETGDTVHWPWHGTQPPMRMSAMMHAYPPPVVTHKDSVKMRSHAREVIRNARPNTVVPPPFGSNSSSLSLATTDLHAMRSQKQRELAPDESRTTIRPLTLPTFPPRHPNQIVAPRTHTAVATANTAQPTSSGSAEPVEALPPSLQSDTTNATRVKSQPIMASRLPSFSHTVATAASGAQSLSMLLSTAPFANCEPPPAATGSAIPSAPHVKASTAAAATSTAAAATTTAKPSTPTAIRLTSTPTKGDPPTAVSVGSLLPKPAQLKPPTVANAANSTAASAPNSQATNASDFSNLLSTDASTDDVLGMLRGKILRGVKKSENSSDAQPPVANKQEPQPQHVFAPRPVAANPASISQLLQASSSQPGLTNPIPVKPTAIPTTATSMDTTRPPVLVKPRNQVKRSADVLLMSALLQPQTVLTASQDPSAKRLKANVHLPGDANEKPNSIEEMRAPTPPLAAQSLAATGAPAESASLAALVHTIPQPAGDT